MDLATVATLVTIFNGVWDLYCKTIDKKLKEAWERRSWEDRGLAYGQKVQSLYGEMQILGQPKPVSLESIYTAINLLDRPTALSRYTVEEMQADFTGRGRRYFHASDKEKRRDGLDMVKGGENLFILGKLGAGKTTFLKHVALRGVNGDLKRVLIFIGLKQLSDSGLSVFDFVVDEFEVCDFPDAAAYLDRLLKAGKAILLFDGLDEVNVADDERKSLISDVETFTRKYDQCQRLITCRLAANDYSFQGYTYVEMADFDEAQVGTFIAKWFGDDVQRRELFLSELQKSESEGLRELARVPLLLALLCLGFEETLKLSSRRVELYEEALDALLKKWDVGRNIRRDEPYRELSLKRKEQMLSQVAAETFDRAEYFIPRKTLARSFETFLSRVPNAPPEVDGEAVLRAIVAQHGLFTERARDIYSFAHLTFQEYFTARYVVENEARGTLPRLIDHYADPRYREVFLLTAAQLPDATEFFDLFARRLAADAAERPAVAGLLRQVARKAATADSLNAAAARSIYVFLARARALALDLALARARARALALDLARALARARDLALARALARARDLALDLAHSPHAQLARDILLVNARLLLSYSLAWPDKDTRQALWTAAEEILAAAMAQSRASSDTLLAERLSDLNAGLNGLASDPNQSDPRDVSAGLDSALEAADLAFPALGEADRYFVSDYLNGNRLLLECLKQAVVADREAIKDRLLLLPEA